MTFIRTIFITVFLSWVSISSIQGMIPDSFQEIRWYPIKYEDDMRKISAKLPGELQAAIATEQKCLYSSTMRNCRYAIHFNPSADFTPPDTLDEFVSRFNSIPHAQIIPLAPNQPHVRYLLQINFFDEGESDIQFISHVYATENMLVIALVEGRDFYQADEFFQSILIEK